MSNQSRKVEAITLSVGENPHVARGVNSNLTIMHFENTATLQETVHSYVTPEEGAVITHEVPLSPTGKGHREPHAPVTLLGDHLNFSTTQVEFNPYDRSVIAAAD